MWALIDAQYRDGKLWELYRSNYLPSGEYRMELYFGEDYWDEVWFSIQRR